MNLINLLWPSDLVGAPKCPNGLINNNKWGPVITITSECFQLVCNDFICLSSFSFFQCVSYADYCVETQRRRGSYLLRKLLVALSLRPFIMMTQHNPKALILKQLPSSTYILPNRSASHSLNILSSNGHGIIQKISDRVKVLVRCLRSYHDFQLRRIERGLVEDFSHLVFCVLHIT